MIQKEQSNKLRYMIPLKIYSFVHSSIIKQHL